MEPPQEFWSCDWGTSSLRLRLVRTAPLEILAETNSELGARTIYDRAIAEGKSSERERATLFARELTGQLSKLLSAGVGAGRSCPLIISGMASSTIGWKELPYARLPFHLDGRSAVLERLDWPKPESVSETVLISGVASATDMMRGEETEAIGVMSFPEFAEFQQGSWLILPGTHSKHLRLVDGTLQDFYTCMTGELFELLARQSILKASVESDVMAKRDWNEGRSAFREGVEWVRERGLPRSLFRTRTRAVLGKQPHAENGWFLSGVLIGAEMAETKWKEGAVIIGGAGRLPVLYEEALATLSDGKARCRRLKEPQGALAAVAGQRLLLDHLSRIP